MTVTEKLTALLAAANATTGASDADLTAAISSLIDGYGGGGGSGVLYETGTISYHTGTAPKTVTVPCSDLGMDHYIVYMRAKKHWKKNGEAWEEVDGLDFTDVSEATGYLVGYILLTDLPIDGVTYKRTNGTSASIEAAYGVMGRIAFTAAGLAQVLTTALAKNASGLRPTATQSFCSAYVGLTFLYDIWGWNDAE